MRILVIADEEEKGLWDFYTPDKIGKVDLIISCGDLKASYLEFLVTMQNCDLLYVHGNHDRHYEKKPPEGCIDIEDRIFMYKGLRILGLGGSMRYKPGSCMYTEEEMRRRVEKLRSRIVLKNGFDILVTHSPAKGYGDMEDLPHQGFACFNDLLEQWHPKYMVHGHVHKSYGAGKFERVREHPGGTRIVNACGHTMIEIADGEYPAPGQTGSAIYDLYVSLRRKVNPDFS